MTFNIGFFQRGVSFILFNLILWSAYHNTHLSNSWPTNVWGLQLIITMLRRYDLAMWKQKLPPSCFVVGEDMQSWPFHIPPTISFSLFPLSLICSVHWALDTAWWYSGYHIYCSLYASFNFGMITFSLHFSVILVGTSNLHIGKGNCDWVMHDIGLGELGRQYMGMGIWKQGWKRIVSWKGFGVIFPMS